MALPQTNPSSSPPPGRSGSGRGSIVARVAAVAAVVGAVVIAAILLFGGGPDYTVKVQFQNAGQLVKGNQVQVGGRPIGSITAIRLTEDGLAEVEIKLDKLKPLHEGTTATIRATSLSGIANRYIALDLGPNSSPKIESGGRIDADRTTSPVDLDQLFNTLDEDTRKGLQQIVQGSADQYKGKSKQANEALHYFNPALSTSSALTRELIRDRVVFQRFITDTSEVVTDLAERREDLTGLVSNTNATAQAIGDENVALARALGLLPTTIRKANTTFVNLRATLDDLDVLVDESKPATRELAPFLRELRPLVRDARPTIRDLRRLIRRPGEGNDLIELNQKAPRLASMTSRVFPRSVRALADTQEVLEYARPYTPDLAGWFTKFGTGAATYDANGHYARIQPLFNAFQLNQTPAGNELVYAGPTDRLGGLETRQEQRCPGGAMQPPPDGSAPWVPGAGFDCDPNTTPPPP